MRELKPGGAGFVPEIQREFRASSESQVSWSSASTSGLRTPPSCGLQARAVVAEIVQFVPFTT